MVEDEAGVVESKALGSAPSPMRLGMRRFVTSQSTHIITLHLHHYYAHLLHQALH